MKQCTIMGCLCPLHDQVVKLIEALNAVKKVLQCCSQMTIAVPSDSVAAGIPYCPIHGRHRQPNVFNALIVVHDAIEVGDR